MNSGLVLLALVTAAGLACGEDGSDSGDGMAGTADSGGVAMDESTGGEDTGSITTGLTTALTTMNPGDDDDDSTGAGGSDDSGESGPDGALSCESYCGIYMDACDDFSLYDNVQACMDHCSQWPLGSDADTEGDTLGCRLYHVTVASSTDPAIHCPHSAPNGDAVCADADAPDCTTYCETYMGNCTEDNGVYVDMQDCLDQCAPWYPGIAGETDRNTIGCRTYHGGAPAFGDPETHCPHAGPGGAGVCVFLGA